MCIAVQRLSIELETMGSLLLLFTYMLLHIAHIFCDIIHICTCIAIKINRLINDQTIVQLYVLLHAITNYVTHALGSVCLSLSLGEI